MCKIMVSYVHVCEILATNSVESPNKDSYVRTYMYKWDRDNRGCTVFTQLGCGLTLRLSGSVPEAGPPLSG